MRLGKGAERSQIPGWASMAAGSGVPRPGAGVQPAGLDCPVRLSAHGKNVYATGVTHGDRHNEARAGELAATKYSPAPPVSWGLYFMQAASAFKRELRLSK